MLQKISQHTTTGSNNWLRVGVTSLALTLGAMFMSAGSAFATPAEFIWETDDVHDYDLVVLGVGGPGAPDYEGIDDKVAGEFDFTSINWNHYDIIGAKLTLHMKPMHKKIVSDEILIGSKLNAGMTDILDPIFNGGIDLFTSHNNPNGSFLEDDPLLGDGKVDTTPLWLELDLLTMYDPGDLRSKLLSGTPGTIWVKYSDDALIDGMTLELHGEYKPVPEPGSLMLLGTGMIGVAAWRLRKGGKV